MKAYRFIARNCYQKKMYGIFRGLNFEKAKIPDGEYEEIMSVINSELPVPNIVMKNTESWFTNKGYSKFENHILKLLELYEKYSPRYVKEWDIVETEIQLYISHVRGGDSSMWWMRNRNEKGADSVYLFKSSVVAWMPLPEAFRVAA